MRAKRSEGREDKEKRERDDFVFEGLTPPPAGAIEE
jgi:hypothetical protein